MIELTHLIEVVNATYSALNVATFATIFLFFCRIYKRETRNSDHAFTTLSIKNDVFVVVNSVDDINNEINRKHENVRLI